MYDTELDELNKRAKIILPDNKIVTPDDLYEDDILDDLYDDTPPPEDTQLPLLNDDLTESEIEEAPFWNQFKRGLMILTGAAGAGKNTFMFYLLLKLRILFKDFKVVLDKKPRRLFGAYIPFNTNILMQAFQSSDEKYRTGKSDIKLDFADYAKGERKDKLNELIDGWMGENKELFFNTGMGLDEFHRYFNNRDPHHPMNKAISPLFKRWRHQELLVIGATLNKDELDDKKCLRMVTHEIKCQQTRVEGVHLYTIYRTKFDDGKRVLGLNGNIKPVEIELDANAPIARLDGKRIYDSFNSWERHESVPRVKFKAK
jgi:hypothetical protein